MGPVEVLEEIGIRVVDEDGEYEFSGVFELDDGGRSPLRLEVFSVDEEEGTVNCGALNESRFLTVEVEELLEMYRVV
jgi:8-oxo-dGTP pyrophosphatase MutT (NUDIX family)